VLSGRGFDAATPLPPGHPPLPRQAPLRTFTLRSLREAAEGATASSSAGTNDALPLCVLAVKGCVLDARSEPRCALPSGVWRAALGRDLTRTLAFTPLPKELAEKEGIIQPQQTQDGSEQSAASAAAPADPAWPLCLDDEFQGARALEGLSFDQLRCLETWFAYLQQHCPTIGRIMTEQEEALLEGGSGVGLSLPGEAGMEPLPSDIYGSFLPMMPVSAQGSASTTATGSDATPQPRSLHALMDAEERAECREAVLALPAGSPLLETPCTRSGMTPLHRAVENDWPEVVSALLERGADAQAKCALYDGDTALQLARRFHADACVAFLEAARAPAVG